MVDGECRKEVVPKNPEIYKGIATKEDWKGYGFKIEYIEEIQPIEINGKLSLWEYDYKLR